MGYNTPTQRSLGTLITESIYNTDLVDNIVETAVAKVTTQGDIVQATGANALARLAIGTAAQVLGSDGSDAVWVTAEGKMTISIPANAMTPTVSNGCAAVQSVETTAGRPDMIVLDFDHTAEEAAQFWIPMPKRWDEGTLTYRLYWTISAAVATDVIWGLQGVAASDNDTIDVAYGTAIKVTDTSHNTAEDLHVADESAALTVGGSPAENDGAWFRLFRDATAGGDTTNANDARLLGIKLFWTSDALTDD